MNQTFTFKTVLLALLVMICCAAKAETVQYQTDNGFIYEIDLETQEVALSKYNGNATNVVIPEKIAYEGKEYKVTILGVECFKDCSSLASVTLPSSVTILLGSFEGCSSLERIVVDAKNPRYDSREGCNAVIETASNTMVVGCKNTFIPSSVTSLGGGCFYGCSSLTSIAIPSSVTSLGYGCFHRCSSLVSIEIPSSVTSLENWCFQDCSSLASISIPSSVTSLGVECFRGCSSLSSITIPSSVTSLGNQCFEDCSSLASIDIPSSVTSLGEYSFSGCSSLQTVICRMENVESGRVAFIGTPIRNVTLYVPESLLTTYQITDPWDSFGAILPLTEEVELGISDTSKPAFSLHSDDGSVVLSGLTDGTPVSYYSVDGRLLGRTSVDNGSASFSVKPNTIVTVKAGKQSFKVRVK